MLAKFKVRNFKNFRDELCLDLQSIKNYEFNDDAIKNGVIKDAICYGPNASGKSSLGYAIFDITLHLTDKNRPLEYYSQYSNLETKDGNVYFEYTFLFDDNKLVYKYEKENPFRVVREILEIDNRKILVSEENKTPIVNLKGAEQLNVELWNNEISFVKFVAANTALDKRDRDCQVFLEFIYFVNHMLFSSSVIGMRYIGFTNSHGNICEAIANANATKGLQQYLKELGIEYHLIEKMNGENKTIYAAFGDREVPLQEIWSSGTRTLTFLYMWYMQMKNISFLFLDEFDAFYHYELADAVVEKLKKEDVQVIFTSHNTNLMTNTLLRPDCNFELRDNKIMSFSNLTNKALRKAHNIPKMYKAGAFHEE